MHDDIKNTEGFNRENFRNPEKIVLSEDEKQSITDLYNFLFEQPKKKSRRAVKLKAIIEIDHTNLAEYAAKKNKYEAIINNRNIVVDELSQKLIREISGAIARIESTDKTKSVKRNFYETKESSSGNTESSVAHTVNNSYNTEAEKTDHTIITKEEKELIIGLSILIENPSLAPNISETLEEIPENIQRLCSIITQSPTEENALNKAANVVDKYLSNRKTFVFRSNTKENNESFQNSIFSKSCIESVQSSKEGTILKEQKENNAPTNSIFSKSYKENLDKIGISDGHETISDATKVSIENLFSSFLMQKRIGYEEKRTTITTLLNEFNKSPTKENFMKILAAADARRTIWGIFKPHQQTYTMLKDALIGDKGNGEQMKTLFDEYEEKNPISNLSQQYKKNNF